jgi:hypothetical protein
MNINVDKKTTAQFNSDGEISLIVLTVKSSERGNTMKMKIGETVLTDKELIDKNCPFHPEGQILFNSAYMETAIGRSFIEFKSGDIFEFEQPSDNLTYSQN